MAFSFPIYPRYDVVCSPWLSKYADEQMRAFRNSIPSNIFKDCFYQPKFYKTARDFKTQFDQADNRNDNNNSNN